MPRANTAPVAAPTATAVAAPVSKTVQGFAVGFTAFIPVDPKDLRKQAEIPMLLLDIQEGKKDISALIPFLRQQEFRQQHVRKRVTEDEYAELYATPKPKAVEPDTDGSAKPEGEVLEPAGTIGGAEINGED